MTLLVGINHSLFNLLESLPKITLHFILPIVLYMFCREKLRAVATSRLPQWPLSWPAAYITTNAAFRFRTSHIYLCIYINPDFHQSRRSMQFKRSIQHSSTIIWSVHFIFEYFLCVWQRYSPRGKQTDYNNSGCTMVPQAKAFQIKHVKASTCRLRGYS